MALSCYQHLRRLRHCGWILLLLIHAQAIQSQSTPGPSFLEEPADQEVNPGEDVDLRCRLNQAAKVSWLKDGNIQNTEDVYTQVGDTINNDYTIRISGVSVDRDDGVWECQALVRGAMGALRSRKAKLVVRIPPKDRPTLQSGQGGPVLQNGGDLTVRSDLNATAICISRDSNPPATIKWWVGTKDVTDNSQFINQTGQQGKLYNTISTLTYQFMPRDWKSVLKCEISHPALAGSLTTYVNLNVLYAPIIAITQDPSGDITEGHDVTVNCDAPANPSALTKWYQNGRELSMVNASAFRLNNVNHESNGNYTCTAQNDGFGQVRAVYELAVRYGPTFTVQPQGDNVVVDQTITLYCDADANPIPQIRWMQNTTDGQIVQRGDERNLSIIVDYSAQGKYWCRASNTINDKENIVMSDVAELLVKGPPRFETAGSNPRNDVPGEKGSDSTLVAVYCSQPEPTKLTWYRDQRDATKQKATLIQVDPKKYQITKVPLQRPGCYESRLKVMQLDSSDSGRYRFTAGNAMGEVSIPMQLSVRDSSSTSVIVGVVVGVGSALIIALVAILCCYRTKRFCFASGKSTGTFDVEKRETKQENGEAIRPSQKDDNLKQNPLQSQSMFPVTDKKPNGNSNHHNSNGVSVDLPKKNGRMDGMPAEVLHYAQLDVDNGPKENGHHGNMGTPRMERERTEYTDIRPTVL